MVRKDSQREVGWLITKTHFSDTERVGWGQLRAHATETESSFHRPAHHTVFMDKSLTEHMIPDDEKVRWRSFDDDDNPAYDGIVKVHWLLDDSSEYQDLAYNVDRFNYTDVGAVHVYYSVEDIIECARKLDKPDWELTAKNHPASKLGESWIEIYA